MIDLCTDKEYLELLGERLKQHRLKHNITQKELAEFCGVSRPTIVSFEKGAGIHLLNFVRILRKMDLDAGLIDLVPEIKDIDPFKPRNKPRKRAR